MFLSFLVFKNIWSQIRSTAMLATMLTAMLTAVRGRWEEFLDSLLWFKSWICIFIDRVSVGDSSANRDNANMLCLAG